MIIDLPLNRIPIVLTRREARVLVDDTIAVPPEILKLIEKAPPEGDHVRLFLTLDDLELLLDGIAAEANHAKSRKWERFFDALYDRLNPIFERAVRREKGQEEDGAQDSPVQDVLDKLAHLISAGRVNTPEDMTKQVAELIGEHNETGSEETGGLSPKQVYLLNRCGWWAEPYPVRLKRNLSYDEVRHSVLLQNVRALLQKVEEEKGAPLTMTGNLKREFVAGMMEHLSLPADELDVIRRMNKVINERDVWPLHIARIICQAGGLLKKNKARLVVTGKAKQCASEAGAGELFAQLFDALFHQTNLAYFDPMQEVPGIQITFPYGLYRLAQLEPTRDHEIRSIVPIIFLPAVRKEIGAPTELVDRPTWMLSARILRPLEMLALVEISPPSHGGSIARVEHAVKKLPLFDAFVSFQV